MNEKLIDLYKAMLTYKGMDRQAIVGYYALEYLNQDVYYIRL